MSEKRNSTMGAKKIGIICAPGGHLVQALSVLEGFDGHEVFLISYDSDVLNNFRFRSIEKVYRLKFYGANNLKIMANLLLSIPKLIKIMREEKPDFLFSTGSEIAIPAFYMAKWFSKTKLIFLETVVRSHTPTLTARVVYPVTDLFLVQWKHMIRKIGPKAKFVGSIL
ncbi:MAG: capsular biosynthesis protein [Candidatus Omnitrophica bacterium]|nr:capsular biosynthesis protein [Candidatus Omnitrophota bacterium]